MAGTVRQVVRFKRQAEVNPFACNFAQQLEDGESIVEGSWEYTVSVIWGSDPSPSSILLGTPTLSGTVVTQRLQQGIPGCIYLVNLQVTTSNSRIIQQTEKLAVLPNDYPAEGAFVTLYGTSQPYPYYDPFPDLLSVTARTLAGILETTFYQYSWNDSLSVGASTLAGVLQSLLLTYDWQDSLSVTPSVNTGTLVTQLVTYNWNQDTLAPLAGVLAGTLNTILITYTYTDSLSVSASVLAGTLSA